MALARAFLLLTLLAASALPADEPACRYKSARGMVLVSRLFPIMIGKEPLVDPLCRRMEFLHGRFEQMLPAARAIAEREAKGMPLAFPLERASFSDTAWKSRDRNGMYLWTLNRVDLTEGLLRATLDDDLAATYVVGHELAHGVQRALLIERDPCDRGYESQADIWGLEMMRAAGYLGPGKAPRAVSGALASGGIRVESADLHRLETECDTHPALGVRVSNALLADAAGMLGTPAVAAAARSADADAAKPVFDGAGAADASRLVLDPGPGPSRRFWFSRPRPEGFTGDGRLIVRKVAQAPPPLAPYENPSAAEGPRVAALRSLYAIGNVSAWTDPIVVRVLDLGALRGAGDLHAAIRAGIDALSPSTVAEEAVLKLLEKREDFYRGRLRDLRMP